jgi:ParB-like chromosome segregation protein Spo0J
MTTKKQTAGFQTIALTRIHESTTNPRNIFDESQLAELAASRRRNRRTSLASLELR